MNKNHYQYGSVSILGALFVIIFLSIGFVPNLGAVDKIAPQWLFMTIINGASRYITYNRSFSDSIRQILTSYMSLAYIAFIFWAFVVFHAINPTEVVVNFTRQANVLLMYLSMGIFLFSFKQKTKFISWVITLILSIEIYAVIVEAQNMINLTGVISPGTLKGVTANRNITAFSLAIKLPFVLFLFYVINKKIYKLFLALLVFLSLVCLSMIQSRASFVGVALVY